MLTFFVAKVDSKLRSDTTKKSLCDALDASGKKHIRNMWNKGSLVSPNHLRFDFFAKVTDEELHQVEDFVNARIQEQLPLIERRDIPAEEKVLWLCLVRNTVTMSVRLNWRAWSFVEEFT
jgi:alanyl-tRNA synthetase